MGNVTTAHQSVIFEERSGHFFILKHTRCTNFTNFIVAWNCTCFGHFVFEFPCITSL